MKNHRGYKHRVRVEEIVFWKDRDRDRLQLALIARGVPGLLTEALLGTRWLRCAQLLEAAPRYDKEIKSAFAFVYKQNIRPKAFKCPRKHKALSAATFRRWNLPHRGRR